jgi:hypothetical protein
MPRKRARNIKRRQKFEEIRPETVFFLKFGRYPSKAEIPHNSFAQFGDPPGYREAVWLAIGKEIIQKWTTEYPGTRPHGWWRYTDPGDIYPEPEDEACFLLELGQLTPSEIKILEERTK